jgi:hypothetical protein
MTTQGEGKMVQGQAAPPLKIATDRKPRERRTPQERIDDLLEVEQAHLVRAEKAKAKRFALMADLKQRADAIYAAVEQGREGEA